MHNSKKANELVMKALYYARRDRRAKKRNKAFKSHILEKKSPKRKRNFRKAVLVSKSDYKRVAKLLPNG